MASEAPTVGYAEIADMLGVAVNTVRIYAGTDPNFPQRVTSLAVHSPRFALADAERYVTARSQVRRGRRGRPPKAAWTKQFGKSTSAVSFPDQVRTAVFDGHAGFSTMVELADRLGLTPSTLGARMRGQVRWTTRELKTINKLLGVPTDGISARP